MTLTGKGFFIWKIKNCESGNATSIASVAQAASLSHVLIKIADGAFVYNYDSTNKVDLIPPVVQALRAKGLQVWGWHYIYGNSPAAEAQIAISQTKKYNLDGYVIDAEGEFDKTGMSNAATTFVNALRAGLPNTPIALSSYRYPSLHASFPWASFLAKCDYNMPQVYWVGAHNAGAQLKRCVQELQGLSVVRPIIPTGCAVGESGWEPTTSDLTDFMNTAISLNLKTINFWEWGESHTGTSHPNWDTIANFKWPWSTATITTDIIQTYINALNSHSVDQVMKLYSSQAVHITAKETIQGTSAIKAWYTNFFDKVFPNATYTLLSDTLDSSTGSTHHISWSGAATNRAVGNISETIGVLNNLIVYHYSGFPMLS
jgi:hypothetical protein